MCSGKENQDLVEECRKKVCWREACSEKIGSGSAIASKPPGWGKGLDFRGWSLRTSKAGARCLRQTQQSI